MDMREICDAAGVRVMLVPQAHWNDEEIAVVKLGELRRIAEQAERRALTADRRESERIVHSQERLRGALAQLGFAVEGDLPTLVERACGALLGQESALSASARPSEVQQGLLETPVRFPVTCVRERAERTEAENRALRQLLAVHVSGASLYTDDGELQENTQRPFIDFYLDTPADIQRKLQERAGAAARLLETPVHPIGLSIKAQSAIGRWVSESMDQAVANGASGPGIPDELVEIALWLHALAELAESERAGDVPQSVERVS